MLNVVEDEDQCLNEMRMELEVQSCSDPGPLYNFFPLPIEKGQLFITFRYGGLTLESNPNPVGSQSKAKDPIRPSTGLCSNFAASNRIDLRDFRISSQKEKGGDGDRVRRKRTRNQGLDSKEREKRKIQKESKIVSK